MGILSFNSRELDSLLDKHKLKKTWLILLATHLNANQKFAYILESKEFKGAEILKSDLLADLSIGEIGVLYEYSVTYVDRKSRKSNGQFFTPDDVAMFMAKFSNEFPEGVWLDPCSGIGNLSWHLAAIQDNPEKFLKQNLLLSDKDELALLIARTLLVKDFQKNSKDLFNEIRERFITLDFLSVHDSLSRKLSNKNSKLDKIPKHDFVIVNPPYLATQVDERFETGKAGDLYSYFLENIIKTSKGFISITPQSFTNAKKFSSLRSLILRNYKNLRIFNYDNVPANIFKGIKFGSQNTNTSNSIRAAIMVALPGKGKRKISPLLRWRSHERDQLFQYSNKFLSEVELTEDFFPKVEKEFETLFKSLADAPTLSEICSAKNTKYPLYIPSSPRYFIPALVKPVNRASQKTIYFSNEKDRNTAYILVNSSLMYWWWRVRDGGMTLSLETLLSLPIPNFKIPELLVEELMKSEKVNKVYKKNAGVEQENVKHPKALLSKINKVVIPEFASKLIELHDNSDITRILGPKTK